MFLLNSRAPLVTEPCFHIYTNTKAGTPYTEDTGPICRIPLLRLSLHTLGYSPRGTCAGSWYEYFRFFLVPFSRDPGIGQTTSRIAIPRFNQVLIITILP